MVERGTKRPDIDIFKIVTTAQLGMEYGNMGYVDDLQYYQGEDSIFKAQQIAAHMPEDKGKELIDLVKESNEKMEEASNWGGRRPGAGRPPAEEKRRQVNIRMTEEEEKLVKAYLSELRSKE